MQDEIVFGLDIGGSAIKGAPVNIKTGKLIAERFKIKTPTPLTPNQMVEAVKELLAKFNWTGAVGCGFPTLLSNSIVHAQNNLHDDWMSVNVKSFFEHSLQLPFSVINDADAAGIAEAKFGAGKSVNGLVILCTFGTGIGSTMIYNQTLIPNTELGQITINNLPYEEYTADSVRKKENLSYDEWGDRVNSFFSHLEFIFSPSLFIVGGGASKRFEKFKNKLNLNTPILPADMNNEAGVIGAAVGYRQTFL